MKERMIGSGLSGRKAGSAPAAVGLLLAFVLLAAGGLSVYADDLEPPPQIPHYFAGRVSTLTGSIPEGTVVEAFVGGVKKAETTVNAESRYELDVPGQVGDEGKTVTFKVAGVQANETTEWQSGKLDYDFNLTITALPDGSPFPFPFPLQCFIATAAYGTPAAEQVDALRGFRDAVLVNNAPGRVFVALYYSLSPPVANLIARNGLLRTLIRELLIDPIVWVLQAIGDI